MEAVSNSIRPAIWIRDQKCRRLFYFFCIFVFLTDGIISLFWVKLYPYIIKFVSPYAQTAADQKCEKVKMVKRMPLDEHPFVRVNLEGNSMVVGEEVAQCQEYAGQ